MAVLHMFSIVFSMPVVHIFNMYDGICWSFMLPVVLLPVEVLNLLVVVDILVLDRQLE